MSAEVEGFEPDYGWEPSRVGVPGSARYISPADTHPVLSPVEQHKAHECVTEGE